MLSAFFTSIVLLAFTYARPRGEVPRPTAMVVKNRTTGQSLTLDHTQLRDLKGRAPPIGLGPDDLVVVWDGGATMGCFLELGWEVPANILDLMVETRNCTNGLFDHKHVTVDEILQKLDLEVPRTGGGSSRRGFAPKAPSKKKREHWNITDGHRALKVMEKLYPHLVPNTEITLVQALDRGSYMAAVAVMERSGMRIDARAYNRFCRCLADRKRKVDIVRQLDTLRMYDGLKLNKKRLKAFTKKHRIPWPEDSKGDLKMTNDVVDDFTRSHPVLEPFRETWRTLKLKPFSLSIVVDGRCRFDMKPFDTTTARNNASSLEFPLNLARWNRGFIIAAPGHVLIYLDYSSAEFGIGAVLSGDPEMLEVYQRADIYIELGKMSGELKASATKANTPKEIRDRYKPLGNGLLFGIGEASVAAMLGGRNAKQRAAKLMQAHRERFRVYWKWLDGQLDLAFLECFQFNPGGWTQQITGDTRTTSAMNFPLQGSCAQILRKACVLAIEAGVKVTAPHHDALVIEAPEEELECHVVTARWAMVEAAKRELGLALKVDVEEPVHPTRHLLDSRGLEAWKKVWRNVMKEDPDENLDGGEKG